MGKKDELRAVTKPGITCQVYLTADVHDWWEELDSVLRIRFQRAMKHMAAKGHIRQPDRYNSEGSHKCLGVTQKLWAFKAGQMRIYGAPIILNKERLWVGVAYAKKQKQKADQALLRRAATRLVEMQKEKIKDEDD